MTIVAPNTGHAYERVDGIVSPALVDRRWIGRCKRCGQTHKLEGRLVSAKREGLSRHDMAVETSSGDLYTTGSMGTDVVVVPVRCGDHWCNLRLVTEGTKKSKHECGARCTSATGPNCDCRCRGKNHGRDC